MKTVLVIVLSFISFQIFGQQQCSVTEINKAIRQVCKYVNTLPLEEAVKKTEALSFCGGNYAWFQERTVGKFIVKAHRVKPKIKNNPTIITRVIGNLKIFELINDAGLVLKKDGEQKWIAYKWKHVTKELISKKLTIIHRCNKKYASGAGIWKFDCHDCPSLPFDTKYYRSIDKR